MSEIDEAMREAVASFWAARGRAQAQGQESDHGRRSAATSGLQLDPMMDLIVGTLLNAGAAQRDGIHVGQRISVLPGYYRPQKTWDLVVTKAGQLGAVIELKSHIGPSFGNNFNNRSEEALGNASDFWVAYREGAFAATTTPWIGYFMLLEDHPKSRKSLRVYEPLFEVFPEFKGASYMKRYELLLRRLKRERMYTNAAFVVSTDPSLGPIRISEPAQDLAFEPWIRSLIAHLQAIES